MNIKESISFFFFGSSCLGCGRGAMKLDPWLCNSCREELIACGEHPIELSGSEDVVCLFPMTPLTRNLVLAMKYKGMHSIAPYLVAHSSAGRNGEALRILSGWGASIQFLPVPLHGARLRERGYNQCERAALELSLCCRGRLDTKTLKRVAYRPSQTSLGSAKRFLNVAGAFEAKKAQSFQERGRTMVIVDDVYTTGATTSSCARALRKAGFANVKICALLHEMLVSAAEDLAADKALGWRAETHTLPASTDSTTTKEPAAT